MTPPKNPLSALLAEVQEQFYDPLVHNYTEGNGDMCPVASRRQAIAYIDRFLRNNMDVIRAMNADRRLNNSPPVSSDAISAAFANRAFKNAVGAYAKAHDLVEAELGKTLSNAFTAREVDLNDIAGEHTSAFMARVRGSISGRHER